MDMSTFLRPDNILADLDAVNKATLLIKLANRAAASLVLDPKILSQALIAREALGSTGMGEGIAIPHARLKGISTPFGTLARMKQPIDFDAVDGVPVDIVFMLFLPPASEGGNHLNALACAARKLRADGIAQAIRHAGDAAAIYALMTKPCDPS